MPAILHPKRWLEKPPLGSRVNTGHPLGIGMVGCFLLQKEKEAGAINLISGVNYGISSTAPVYENGPVGLALDCDGAGVGIKGTAEPELRLQRVTLLWRGYIKSTPTDFANIAGVSYASGDTSPYTSYMFYKNNAAKLTFGFNNGAFQNNGFRNISDFVGNGLHQFVLTLDLQPTTANQSAYTDDASLDGSGGTTGTILYDTTASFVLGDSVGGRDSNSVCQCAYIWNRRLDKYEIASLWRAPFQMIVPPRSAVTYVSFNVTSQVITGSAGIASEEAFGSGGSISQSAASQTITGSAGIASEEAFGSGGFVLQANIQGFTGIASAEAFGSNGTVTGPITGTAGIASAEAFGSGGIIVSSIEGSAGIASAEAFGSDGTVAHLYGASGIASEEAFGSGGVIAGPITGTAGIPSAEVFGADGFVVWDQTITGTAGILSEEAFGSGGVTSTLFGSSGIASEEAFGSGGTVTASGAPQTITGSTGIASAEAFGSGGVLSQGLTGYSGIPSAEAFGLGGMVIGGLAFDKGPFYVYVDGAVSNYISVESIKGSETLSAVDTATLKWIDPDGSVRPTLLSHVQILYRPDPEDPDSVPVLIFGGYITSMSEERELSTALVKVNCTCSDYGFILDHRLFTYTVPENATVTTVLEAINEFILSEENITFVSTGDPGLTVPVKTYDQVPVTDVLREMKSATGWEYKVTKDRILYFDRNPINPANKYASTDLTDAALSTRFVTLKKEIGKYRNTQHTKLSGLDRSFQRTDTFVGDGTTIEFNTTVEMRQVPEVLVNGVAQTVCEIGSYTSGWQAAYEVDGRKIRFSASNVPASLAVIAVTYPADSANSISSVDTGEVAAVASLINGSGKFEAIGGFGGELGDVDVIGENVRGRFGTIDAPTIEIETDVFGFQVGQVVNVQSLYPYIPLAEYTILSMSWEEIQRRLLRFKLQVGMNGTQGTGFKEMLREKLGTGSGSGGGYGGSPLGSGWNGGTSVFNNTGGTASASGGQIQRYEFNIAGSVPGCTNPGLSTVVVPLPHIIVAPGIIREVIGYVGVHNGNRSIIFDIKLNGATIFSSAQRPSFAPNGSATPEYNVQRFNKFNRRSIPVTIGSLLTCTVVQTGSSDVDASGSELGHDAKVEVVVA